MRFKPRLFPWFATRNKLQLLAVLSPFLLFCIFLLLFRSVPESGNIHNNDDEDEKLTQYYLDKTEFRDKAVHSYQHSHAVIDEVILLLQSGETARCNLGLIKEAIRSALALRSHCVRCDFEITLVADDPIYSAFSQTMDINTNLVAGVFNTLKKSPHYPTAKNIFAAHKARDLLVHASKPFVLFIDADIVANDGTFPEALFDMMHQEYDVVLPIDWAHRHGPLWGRGVPGLCTCIFGFMNAPNVRRLIETWKGEIEKFSTDPTYQAEIKSKFLPDNGYQHRDQELFSLVFERYTFPDIKLFSLSMEWVCANQGSENGWWVEGTFDKFRRFHEAFRNKCKTLHFHSTSMRHFVHYEYRTWLENLQNIGETNDENKSSSSGHGCSGAKRLSQ